MPVVPPETTTGRHAAVPQAYAEPPAAPAPRPGDRRGYEQPRGRSQPYPDDPGAGRGRSQPYPGGPGAGYPDPQARRQPYTDEPGHGGFGGRPYEPDGYGTPAGGPQGYAEPGGGHPAPAYPGDGWGEPGGPEAYAPSGPDSGQYQAYAPDTYAPDTYAPDTYAPDTYAPDTYVPGGPSDPYAPGAAGAGAATALATAPGVDTFSAGGHDDEDDDDTAAPGRGRQGRREPRPPAELDDAPRLPRVPGFDGLRAVALLAVLAFHQGYDVARGGFLGISSFFTLSGFLLGTLALAEWSQAGHLSLARLWERRARRIVPAYVVALAIVVVLQLVLRVGTGPGFRVDVLYALAYAENWRAVFSERDIAQIFVNASPVQHLWSVGLLVQLLVLVPLGFAALMRLVGKRWRVAGAVVAAVAAGSFLLADATAAADGNGGLAYFGTQTRAGEFLVGIVLAFAVLSGAVRRVIESGPARLALRYGGPAALVGLAFLWSRTSLDDPRLFGGVTALNAVLTAWVVLAVTSSGPASTALGSWPLRTLGRLAYTAYLVHWPIFLLLDQPRFQLDEHVQFVARVGLTLALAVALHYAVEQPWREGLRMPRPRLAAVFGGATAVVLVAVMVLPQQPPLGVNLSIGSGSGPGELDVVVPAGGDGVADVALVGDALATSLVPGVATWNQREPDSQVRLATHITDGCPPAAPGPVRLAGATVGEGTACRGWEPRLPHLLDAAEPDVIVVVTGLDELGERDLDGAWHHIGDPAYDTWLANELDELAGTLADSGVPVLWATLPHVRIGGADGDWTRHDENDPARVNRYNELVSEAAAGHDDIQVVDLAAWAQGLTPGGEFGPHFRQDGTTFTERGARGAVTWLMDEVIAAAGVGDGGGAASTTTTAAR
jgi:peptidoglycan/LPS O-acetylase OafA/YrhL